MGLMDKMKDGMSRVKEAVVKTPVAKRVLITGAAGKEQTMKETKTSSACMIKQSHDPPHTPLAMSPLPPLSSPPPSGSLSPSPSSLQAKSATLWPPWLPLAIC